MLKSFKYRLYPTKAQSKLMHDTCFLCSLVYNACLAERKEAYEQERKSLTAYDQIKTLAVKKEAEPRLKEVYSQVLQDVVRRVDKAIQGFFLRVKAGGKPGYPKFRSARYYDSFTYPQSGFSIVKEDRAGRLKLSKIGKVKIKFHRPIEGKIKTLTVRKKAGKWYACFSCQVEQEPLPATGRVVGIDLGLNHLAITSDGEFFPPSKYLRSSERRLKRLQRAVSRRQKGSKRRKKAIRQLQTLHLRVANQRRDQAYKVTHSLLTRYDAVAMEELQPKNMVKNHYLAKSIQDASWGILNNILEAKVKVWGRRLVLVDPKNTSRACSRCGTIVQKTLARRWHECPECGLSVHRDVNAARNILKKSGLDGAFGDCATVVDRMNREALQFIAGSRHHPNRPSPDSSSCPPWFWALDLPSHQQSAQ